MAHLSIIISYIACLISSTATTISHSSVLISRQWNCAFLSANLLEWISAMVHLAVSICIAHLTLLVPNRVPQPLHLNHSYLVGNSVPELWWVVGTVFPPQSGHSPLRIATLRSSRSLNSLSVTLIALSSSMSLVILTTPLIA